MIRRPTRRRRIAWALGTKSAIALALSLPANCDDREVEYRTLDAVADLRSGLPVTVAGHLVGTVVVVHQRGDTTGLRVRFVRGVERLPGTRTAQLRRMGANDTFVLDLRADQRSARTPPSPSFTSGRWLTIRPPDPLPVDPPGPSWRMVPGDPPFTQLLPLAPPPAYRGPTART